MNHLGVFVFSHWLFVFFLLSICPINFAHLSRLRAVSPNAHASVSPFLHPERPPVDQTTRSVSLLITPLAAIFSASDLIFKEKALKKILFLVPCVRSLDLCRFSFHIHGACPIILESERQLAVHRTVLPVQYAKWITKLATGLALVAVVSS